MVSRRTFLELMSLTACQDLFGAPLLKGAIPPSKGTASDEDVTQYVKIAIGTGGHGHTYPGATVPSALCS
jgi:hypothetical protein